MHTHDSKATGPGRVSAQLQLTLCTGVNDDETLFWQAGLLSSTLIRWFAMDVKVTALVQER